LANKVKREEVKAAKDNLKAATLKNKAAQVEAAIEKADIISQQKEAEKNDYLYEIGTSFSTDSKISITKDTKFIRSTEVWADAEFYFYGSIVDAGGKGKANIHLDTKEFGLLKIEASKKMLSEYESNPLYKSYGVRVKGKQNIKSSEIDKSTLQLLEIIGYNPSFKEDYLQSLINKAKNSWADVKDADEWLQSTRGYGA
jgi:hypothetical protein